MTFEQKSMTADEVLGIMAQVVAEYGEDFVYTKVIPAGYTYPVCQNWHDGCPSCLIGHIMHRWGMPEDVLENNRSMGVTTLLSRFQVRHINMRIEAGAQRAMTAAQNAQDEGVPWGDCLEKARDAVADWRLDVKGRRQAETVPEVTVES